MKRFLELVTFLFAFFFMMAGSSTSSAVVLDPGSTVAGKTIGEWTQDWWNWAVSFPPEINPLFDDTGEDANNGQSGPVFFIAGTVGGSANRMFEMPSGKHLLIPLVNTVFIRFPDEDPEDARSQAKGFIDGVDSLQFSLDGVSIPEDELFTHREESGFFTVVLPEDNFVSDPSLAGEYTQSFADGYWLMLEPLALGTHEIIFGGSNTAADFSVTVTDTITVVPEPATLFLFSFGLAGIGFLRQYKTRA